MSRPDAHDGEMILPSESTRSFDLLAAHVRFVELFRESVTAVQKGEVAEIDLAAELNEPEMGTLEVRVTVRRDPFRVSREGA